MPSKPPGEQLTYRTSFNVLCIFCTIHSRCVTPLLRGDTGTAARGLFSVVAGVFMFYLACALADPVLMNYWAAWLIATLAQKLTAKKEQHSQYSGRPALAMLLCPFVSEGTARFIIEPLICFGMGYMLLGESEVVGKLVMSCAFSLMFLENYYRHISRQRQREVIDARIEAEALNQGVKERLGDYR